MQQAQDSRVPVELPLPPVRTSADFMRDWLDARGLTEADGVFEPAQGFIPGFLIGTFDREGKLRRDLSRTRYDRNEAKYMSPKGAGVIIFGPRQDSFIKFEAASTKWIAEGEGKALALAKLGLPTLGIGGVQSWHSKGDSTIHPDLSGIKRGDTVYVAVDGDVQTNDNVRSGASGLLFAIKARGATPKLVKLDPDLGIDDQIHLWRQSGKDPQAELYALPTVSELKGPTDVPVTTYDDILARPPPHWIVKGLIPPGELTAIVGETSCGKTFLTMDLLLAVARQQTHWFGQRIKQSGSVVHVTLEGTGLANRHQAYRQHHKLTDAAPYYAIEVPISLRDDIDALILSIKRSVPHPVVLIAIDTVNRAMGGGDENSSADMGAFLSGANRLLAAFRGAGVLLVHHVGKDPSKGARGHSSFSANVGAELAVSHDDKSGIRTVVVQKQRDGSTDLRFNFRLDVVEVGRDEDQEPVTSCVVVPSLAPVREADADNRSKYLWIWQWYLSEQNDRQPVSKRRIADNVINIRPKGSKVTKKDLEATLVWAVDMGYATLSATQARTGEKYDLNPLPVSKF